MDQGNESRRGTVFQEEDDGRAPTRAGGGKGERTDGRGAVRQDRVSWTCAKGRQERGGTKKGGGKSAACGGIHVQAVVDARPRRGGCGPARNGGGARARCTTRFGCLEGWLLAGLPPRRERGQRAEDLAPA